MSKMLKVIAMLLVIAAVVFAAGCANKAPAPENNTTPATAPTTQAVTPTETPAAALNATETPVAVVAPAVNNTSEVMPAENNTSATGATNLGKAARNRALIESHQSNVTSNSTVNTTQ